MKMGTAFYDTVKKGKGKKEGRAVVLKRGILNKKQMDMDSGLPEILLISSYPPRECGVATYSQDLVKALEKKFGDSFQLRVCALETNDMDYVYPKEVTYKLTTTDPTSYAALADTINKSPSIQAVMIQHEFGFFAGSKDSFLHFLQALSKPVVVVFHTVLPRPDPILRREVQNIMESCASIIVMTKNAAKILKSDYTAIESKIRVIAHGTHLVPHLNKQTLKKKYGFQNHMILATFGLLSSGKGIETTLDSLPSIIKVHPEVLFLIIGKTHPSIVKSEGEKYRNQLEAKVTKLDIGAHVLFINNYIALPELLEYLQLTDIYLFTSKDPNQAVSGTFAYAMSCACPIISTPIPHALEMLKGDTGVIIDFQNPSQVSKEVVRLLNDEDLRTSISSNTLQKSVATAWENSAVAHANLLEEMEGTQVHLTYSLPSVNLAHIKEMTTHFAMVQFSKINQPDIESGYTLDDNVRALVAMCMHFELTGDKKDINYIRLYVDFIAFCIQEDGHFLNYVDKFKKFTTQNGTDNLDDSNGRAVWALGFLISKIDMLPLDITQKAESILQKVLPSIEKMHSTRAMAFSIKGLYYSHKKTASPTHYLLIKILANRLLNMYKHESEKGWEWFEGYLTYANSVLPEAMLLAWRTTGELSYKEVAKTSFDFLLKKTFNEKGIKVISNRSWLQKGQATEVFGEQPIEITYTILALAEFYESFKQDEYLSKMTISFNWFLGKNHLEQVIYNPCTGGCYDGLEEVQINLNQGAESTVCYLMARLTMESYKKDIQALTSCLPRH